MKKIPHPHHKNTGLSLIQVNEDREAMLMKMRGKLAGLSEVHVQATERRRVVARKDAFGWGWKVGVAAILALGSLVYFSGEPEVAVKARINRAPTLAHPPAAMDVNEQALYWAYALYDFDLLISKYGVSKMAIVNSGLAAGKLRELLPRIDARTRFAIERYTFQDGRAQ